MAEGNAAPVVGAFGYVMPHEAAQAKALIDARFIEMTGKPFGYRVTGYLIAVKIYVRPDEIKEIKRTDGSVGKLYISQQSQSEDKFSSVAALVVGIGPQAYKGKNVDGSERFPEGPWCAVCDWVCIPRYESHMFSYRGVAMATLTDDKIMGVIEDPTDVGNITSAMK